MNSLPVQRRDSCTRIELTQAKFRKQEVGNNRRYSSELLDPEAGVKRPEVMVDKMGFEIS